MFINKKGQMMNQIKTTAMAILLALSTNYAFSHEDATCLEEAYTQAEINQCATMTYKLADMELNRVYEELQQVYKNDKLFLKKLKKAQLAWIKLRDADFEMQFPHTKEPGYYGSIFPTCANSYKEELTLKRVLFLKSWLKGVEEGDSCAGSKRRAITHEDEDAEGEMERVCYEEVTPYKDGSKMKDVVELALNINYGNGIVTGEYNYLPAEKDQRRGDIEGSMWKGAISAKYTYEQEGQKDTANLRIHLKDKSAVIESQDKNLGLSTELKQTRCR